jgi:molybdopterin-containing oxidoreductase family membrane subunit
MVETFMAWYSGSIYESALMTNRFTGPYALWYWSLIFFNVLVPQALWFTRVRANTIALFGIAIAVSIGMWLERFIIVVVSLHRDFLPSSWAMYHPTIWDWGMYVGSIGLFFSLLFLFLRFLPMISIFEMRTLLPESEVTEERS